MRAHRFTIMPALAAVILLGGASAPVQAQTRLPGWGAPDARGEAGEAYNNGYARGYREGLEDARSGHQADYRREREYRNADWGYNGRYGSRDEYKRVFRGGFEAGYRDAFSGRGGMGSRLPLPTAPGYPTRRDGDDSAWGYGSYGNGASSRVAFNYGYNDGVERGVKAARSRKAFDPNREGWYRDGDRHYDGDFGPRDRYKASYREGFLRGYEEGYRGLGR